MKKKGMIKKGIALLLTAVMLITTVPALAEPIQAQAEGTQEAATEKTIAGLGTSMIADPTAPESDSDAWKGSYVYYGNYDAGSDETAEPVKYRVLDANTTKFGGTTMLLDCDSILYYQKFDNDGIANVEGKKANDWSISDVKNSLNGTDFLNKEGVFTTAEKKAITASTKEEANTDSDGGI